jgi:hypothetical protein
VDQEPGKPEQLRDEASLRADVVEVARAEWHELTEGRDLSERDRRDFLDHDLPEHERRARQAREKLAEGLAAARAFASDYRLPLARRELPLCTCGHSLTAHQHVDSDRRHAADCSCTAFTPDEATETRGLLAFIELHMPFVAGVEVPLATLHPPQPRGWTVSMRGRVCSLLSDPLGYWKRYGFTDMPTERTMALAALLLGSWPALDGRVQSNVEAVIQRETKAMGEALKAMRDGRSAGRAELLRVRADLIKKHGETSEAYHAFMRDRFVLKYNELSTEDRACEHCFRFFTPTDPRAKFCSGACRVSVNTRGRKRTDRTSRERDKRLLKEHLETCPVCKGPPKDGQSGTDRCLEYKRLQGYVSFGEELGFREDASLKAERLSEEANLGDALDGAGRGSVAKVAGVAVADLVQDVVFDAIDRAIEDGSTLEDFRDEFGDRMERIKLSVRTHNGNGVPRAK